MQVFLFVTTFASVVLNAGFAAGAIGDVSQQSITCFTVEGKESVKSVPTFFNTVTVKATKTITTQGATSTKTVTKTDTVVFTASTRTDTSSEVITVISTTVAYSTPPVITKTSTKTTIVTVNSTSTTTVSATSGFRPVQSTLTKSDKKKRDGYWDRIHARDILMGLSKRAYSVPKYPQSVDCKLYIISTSTLYETHSPESTSIASGPTITVTATKTVTTDRTTSPVDRTTVKSTKYATTTSTDIVPASTTTKTITKTTTTTDIVPGPTLYLACTGDNMLVDTDSHLAYCGVKGPFFYTVYTYDIPTGYDCCVACLSQFNCTGGNFNQGYCSFGVNNVCGPQQSLIQIAEYGENDNGGLSNPIFNGYCGEIDSREYIGD